jgi:hypothetical protein
MNQIASKTLHRPGKPKQVPKIPRGREVGDLNRHNRKVRIRDLECRAEVICLPRTDKKAIL